MTGSQGPTGQDMLRGAQLAAEALNTHGGVLGKRIVVVGADDRADPARGVQVAHQMVKRGVHGVVGPFNSSVGVEALPVYRDAGIPIARLTSASTTQGFGVTTQPMQGQIAPVEADALTKVLHAQSVAILYDPSTFTAAVASQLRGLLSTTGVRVPVIRSVSPSSSGATLNGGEKSALAAVSASRPSVTYLAMYGPQAGAMVAAMHGQKTYGQCFVDLAAQGSEFTQAAGQSAATCLASGVPSPSQLPGGPAYVQSYEARFHTTPGIWGPFAYDSVELLAASAQRAGSWSDPAVAQQLAKTSGYSGVTGTITIAPTTGNRVNPPVVVLDISPTGVYAVNATWATHAGYRGATNPAPAPTTTTKPPPPPTTTTSKPPSPPTTTTTAPPASTTTTTQPPPPTTTTTALPASTTTTTQPPPPTTTTTAPPASTTTTSGGKKPWSGKTIRFGALFSSTGAGGPVGQSQVEGVDLAVDQINASGGIKGARLSVTIVDDKSSPSNAATDMKNLAKNGELAVLGPTFSNSAVQADPVADSLGLPVLAVSNTGEGIVGTCPYPCTWIFRDSLGEATAIPANVNTYVADAHPSRAVVIAPAGDAFGSQTAEIATKALQADHVTVGAPVTVPLDEPALGRAVAAALASKPSVLAITASSPTLAARIITDARKSGFKGGILGGNAFNSPAASQAAGAAGSNAQSGAAWYAGNPSPVNASFVAAFKARYHSSPDQFAAQAYTGVKLLAAAAGGAPLTFVNTTADRSSIKNSLATVSLETPLGTFRFTADHDVDQPVWVVAMNGKGGYFLVKKVP